MHDGLSDLILPLHGQKSDCGEGFSEFSTISGICPQKPQIFGIQAKNFAYILHKTRELWKTNLSNYDANPCQGDIQSCKADIASCCSDSDPCKTHKNNFLFLPYSQTFMRENFFFLRQFQKIRKFFHKIKNPRKTPNRYIKIYNIPRQQAAAGMNSPRKEPHPWPMTLTLCGRTWSITSI